MYIQVYMKMHFYTFILVSFIYSRKCAYAHMYIVYSIYIHMYIFTSKVFLYFQTEGFLV